MNARYGSTTLGRTKRARLNPADPIVERTVSHDTPSASAMVPTFQCSAKNNRRISAFTSAGIMVYPDAKGSMRLPSLPQHWQTSTTVTVFSSRTSCADASSSDDPSILATGDAFGEP